MNSTSTLKHLQCKKHTLVGDFGARELNADHGRMNAYTHKPVNCFLYKSFNFQASSSRQMFARGVKVHSAHFLP